MKSGDLVLLEGDMWTSYGREGEIGLLLDIVNDRHAGCYSLISWPDGECKLYKTRHLRLISDSQ